MLIKQRKKYDQLASYWAITVFKYNCTSWTGGYYPAIFQKRQFITCKVEARQ